MTPTTITSPRKQILVDFFREVWNAGDVDACPTYLAPSYTIHHDPGDPWAGQTLDVAGFQDRLRISRAPFPDQVFEIRGLFEDRDVVAAMPRISVAIHRGHTTATEFARDGVAVGEGDVEVCGVGRHGAFEARSHNARTPSTSSQRSR